MSSHLFKESKASLFSVFFTFFIDNLCWSIVFPIFAPYFLNPTGHLFAEGTSEGFRTLVLSFFLMAFFLGQFMGAPVIGEYADRNGRKKALLLSIFCTSMGLLLSAWSMEENWLILLFIGRLATGIFAGNVTVCLACVADLSADEKTKIRNFGILSLCAGLAFILGTFLGGKLSDPTVSASFRPSFPLWMAAGVTLINFLFVWLGFRETATIDLSVRFDFLESFHNIRRALQTEKIKRVYAIYFFFLFSWTILFQFTPVLAVRSFHLTSSTIGSLASYMGVCWALGSAYPNRILLRYFRSLRVLEFCFICFTILSALVAFLKQLSTVVGLLGASAVIGGMAWPLFNNLISNLAPRQIQGKILGISQSVQSLAMTLGPIAGTIAYFFPLYVVFLIGAAASLLASSIYFSLKI